MISKQSFHITPAYAIEQDIDDRCAYVIVSSSNRYDVLADQRANVLALHFADTEEKKRSDAIGVHDVKAIVEFLENTECSDVYICCDEGISRSSAICAGLLKCSGRDDHSIWKSTGDYRPNVLVYRTMLEYFYPRSEISKELKNIASRSPEEYRYFRKNGKDLEYNKILYRDVCGSQICYGFIYGRKKHVVLFVKVGRDGSVFGYRNKYLNMANYIAEKHGITVIVSSNPFCSFKWKEALNDASEVISGYFEEQDVDKEKAKVLYYGHSDGASMIATYGKDYELFDALLLSNLPLPVVKDGDRPEKIYAEAIKIMLNMAYINNTRPLIMVFGEHDEAYKTFEQIVTKLFKDYGQIFEVHVIKNEGHRISEPVVKILTELFFDENVLIDKGLE